jgi:hypothetical protein
MATQRTVTLDDIKSQVSKTEQKMVRKCVTTSVRLPPVQDLPFTWTTR